MLAVIQGSSFRSSWLKIWKTRKTGQFSESSSECHFRIIKASEVGCLPQVNMSRKKTGTTSACRSSQGGIAADIFILSIASELWMKPNTPRNLHRVYHWRHHRAAQKHTVKRLSAAIKRAILHVCGVCHRPSIFHCSRCERPPIYMVHWRLR